MTPGNLHQCRVVVADDSDAFRTSLVRFLSTLPNIVVVDQVTNGYEALQSVESTRPDILLLDIQMPKMDGIEVLRHLQAMALEVLVVVLSAHENSYSAQALANGATAFVSKGDISKLYTTLTELGKMC